MHIKKKNEQYFCFSLVMYSTVQAHVSRELTAVEALWAPPFPPHHVPLIFLSLSFSVTSQCSRCSVTVSLCCKRTSRCYLHDTSVICHVLTHCLG